MRIHFTCRLDDGTEYDSSYKNDPLELTVGQSEFPRGLEAGIVDMAVGEVKTITIPPDEAFGPHQRELMQTIDRDMIPETMGIELGMELEAPGPDKQPVRMTVVELSDESVTLDANHPLAGKNLTFDVELVAIGD